MPITHEHISRTVKAYQTARPECVDELNMITDLLDAGVDITPRTEFRGHATAGAVLVNDEGLVLHIHHKGLGRWLLPGGHLEPGDESLRCAARRELSEETGFDLEQVSEGGEDPVHVDVHLIPANPAKGEPDHHHFDFRFLFRTSGDAGELQAEEVTGADWFGVDALPSPLRDHVRAAIV
ncbi:8-oxo-dGTP pyrophosphatase MutT, NUDIX family [Saccharopolyspora antimicrobica]|uniref:8-oxo-dGTP pyrophosphatase MutT (NUDIX family) n=1 Tax=Saccharopolyspora antimicrobica TaxID=455193 RepID=A0A1I5HKI2_9PSEU|nr:NUDIX domain-containing protein [Saccharopolyspora antimicrobica]RKT85253.1 8-oxo-dGTP pyrophosphatase MutT (NUDIX family) [Saccharopolyspora antimicrobica]SFO48530.1 8-oxo-dGTP pyrophosphatase MutT, NUDIX family [Saccharopolyspora antimicrobica]